MKTYTRSLKATSVQQKGFTLVEIAIVLMIIGLLIGGILRGQELITSARVRNLVDQKSALQTAIIGFQDRYKLVPGDITLLQRNVLGNDVLGQLGVQAGGPGGDGLIPIDTDSVLVMQNLTAKGFITCSLCLTPVGPGPTTPDNALPNVFGGLVRVGTAAGAVAAAGAIPANTWLNTAVAPARMVMSTGAAVGSQILQELDRKADDASPLGGGLRYGNFDGNAGVATCTGTVTAGAATVNIWANPTESNCEGTWLL